ncbi:disease resistance protein RPM1-like [Hibiscus syriacus]|uniref:disease resistance protein RPM1-like n=1 Tax=Hibiscus syriacus TaxID=106335 RepID=UPI0019210B91|nr:disease resistance protein RPM1-like [Hibiscus syriacus]
MVDGSIVSKDNYFRGRMGGLGKTTLIANNFNKQVVKQHFDCCAWITVSQQYVVTGLLKSMIEELYGKNAFVGKDGQCPPYLVPSARRLIAKCEGLPLAIVALGGLMASKNSIPEWNEVYNNLNWELSENDTYFERLKIWLTEGFVEPRKGTIPEVVAERYLTELIGGGLIQVVRSGSGRLKKFKMHDILRELAVSISKSIKFVIKSDGIEVVEDKGIRRWSIKAKEKEMKAASMATLSRVRSLLVFAGIETSKSSFNKLTSGFKLMRVLYLEDTPINELPDELVNLFNLRYLNKNSSERASEIYGQALQLRVFISEGDSNRSASCRNRQAEKSSKAEWMSFYGMCSVAYHMDQKSFLEKEKVNYNHFLKDFSPIAEYLTKEWLEASQKDQWIEFFRNYRVII